MTDTPEEHDMEAEPGVPAGGGPGSPDPLGRHEEPAVGVEQPHLADASLPSPAFAADVPPRPRPRRASGRGIVAVGVTAAVVFWAAYAVGLSVHQHRSASHSSAAAQPATPTPPPSALRAVVVQPTDTTTALTVRLLPGGTQVQGQPTLDLCNGSFPSESLRTARLQDVALDNTGSAVLSTEAVLYSSTTATLQALQELRNVAARCPKTPVSSPNGEATVTTIFEPAPDATWPHTPTVDRVAFSFHTTDGAGQTRHSIAVYLRRGRILLGVYFAQPDTTQPAIAGRSTIAGLVDLFSTRIAQLPHQPSTANAHHETPNYTGAISRLRTCADRCMRLSLDFATARHSRRSTTSITRAVGQIDEGPCPIRAAPKPTFLSRGATVPAHQAPARAHTDVPFRAPNPGDSVSVLPARSVLGPGRDQAHTAQPRVGDRAAR